MVGKSYPDSFTRLVHNDLVFHPAGIILLAGCGRKRRLTCLLPPVADTVGIFFRQAVLIEDKVRVDDLRLFQPTHISIEKRQG